MLAKLLNPTLNTLFHLAKSTLSNLKNSPPKNKKSHNHQINFPNNHINFPNNQINFPNNHINSHNNHNNQINPYANPNQSLINIKNITHPKYTPNLNNNNS